LVAERRAIREEILALGKELGLTAGALPERAPPAKDPGSV